MQQPLVLAVHFLGSFTWAVLCLRRGFCFRSLETASEWALSSPGLPIALRAKLNTLCLASAPQHLEMEIFLPQMKAYVLVVVRVASNNC